jgi:hypothetical protein
MAHPRADNLPHAARDPSAQALSHAGAGCKTRVAFADKGKVSLRLLASGGESAIIGPRGETALSPQPANQNCLNAVLI